MSETTKSPVRGVGRPGGKPASLAGLTDAIGRIMAGRVGQAKALRRSEILVLIRQLPQFRAASDRLVRDALEELRALGWLICNIGDNAGYFVAGDPQEYQAYRRFYLSYVSTMQARLKRMDQAASEKWGAAALQPPLF